MKVSRALRRCLLGCCALVATASWRAEAEPIRFGIYKLKGANPDGMKKYEGRIVIQKEGTNYRLTWFIGPKANQAQIGIGILSGKVLSVGYMDASGRDFGVVSLQVLSPKKLKGRWAPLLSQGAFGEEEYIFETDVIPEEFRPAPVKPGPRADDIGA